MRLIALVASRILATVCAAGAVEYPASTVDSDVLTPIRAHDLRVTQIGYRLAAANVALCDRLEPGTGIVLHAIDQYDRTTRPQLARYFAPGHGAAVELVLPGSAAEHGGVRADDALVAIDGHAAVVPADGPFTTATVVRLSSQIAGLPPGAPIRLDVIRAGAPLQLTVYPQPICRSRYEVVADHGYASSADGDQVQLTDGLEDALDDADLAVIVAHEIAHNVLHHPQKLDAAHVAGGVLAGFGRSVGYYRQTEIEADILSVSLLANAGYDPKLAAAFWRGFGQRNFASAFAIRTHPAPIDRAATTAHEAELVAADSKRPHIPPILASRNRPLDGGWQAILIRGAA